MTDHIRSHLDCLVGERHPLSSPHALQRAEQYLTEHFTELGWDVSAQSFQALGGTYRNIVADHPSFSSPTQHSAFRTQHWSSGPSPHTRTSPLIIAAHYDTVVGSPGADDNASGLVVLLEVARCLGDVTLPGPMRLIAFCLEEENLLGSLAYVQLLKQQNQQIRGAIVLECVGYTSAVEGSQRIPPGTPVEVPAIGDFLGIVGNQTSAELVSSFERTANTEVPALKTVSLVVPGQGEMLPDVRRSDHAAFWDFGFPALMLTDTADFRNPHYHQPTDTLDTLDLHFIARVASAVTESARALTGSS